MILARRQVLPLAFLALQACASAPPAQYFRLAPVAGAVLPTGPGAIQVREIGIPAYIDQNGIALPSGPYQFASSANDLWAEPLGQMLQAVLVQDLAQRLPRMRVEPSSGMVGAPADLLIEINVLRFDPDASGRVTLIAQTALKAAAEDRFLWIRPWQAGAMPSGQDMASMMAAMSTLLAGLADALAQGVASRNGV